MTHTHSRLIWLDLLRAMAILAMVVFHFTFDLMYFGYIKAGTVFQPEWRMFERSIAISFLFLAGLSWQHIHRAGIKWLTVWRRVALLGVAAAGISIVTYFTFGPYMIRFGILHLILVMSLLSLPLLSLHWAVPLACAAALGSYFIWVDGPVQGSVWWMWIIWTSETTGSVDYRPIMPWGFAFLGTSLWRRGMHFLNTISPGSQFLIGMSIMEMERRRFFTVIQRCGWATGTRRPCIH